LLVLPTGAGKTIVFAALIRRLGERWTAVERLPDGTIHTLISGVSLSLAQGTAEDHIRRIGVGVLVDPNAPWRRSQFPPTARQLAVLHRNRVPLPPNLTRGEASDLIARSIAGRGWS
jgi:hypothetical protein